MGIDDSNSDLVVKQVIVIIFCVIWGILGALLFSKISKLLDKFLGYAMGAALGAGLVAGLVYAVRDPVGEAAGPAYNGWEQFATISIGVPVAFLMAYLCRDFIKFCIILATALAGAATATGGFMGALDCAEVDTGGASKPIARIMIAAALAGLGCLTQFYLDKRVVHRSTQMAAEPRDQQSSKQVVIDM